MKHRSKPASLPTSRAWAAVLAAVAFTACTPRPDQVVDHFLGLQAARGRPVDVVARAEMITSANRLRHSDEATYRFAARCIMDLESAATQPPSECREPVTRLFFGARPEASEPTAAAPVEPCVTSPINDRRCIVPCMQRCFPGGRGNPNDPCVQSCIIETARRINEPLHCGTQF